ncbi:MAG TPA: N-acetylglucosamine-6-phosphate deacetylase [Ktedonosporobacter sp.]|nr:N-acetylglucosamine-6-phosphate deacetylase [Ktedonosporobacter sp.]
MRFTLRGARLVDATNELPQDEITIDGTQIQGVGSSAEKPGTIIDVSNMIVTPGFIDVHTHGGGSFNLHTTNVEEIHAYRRWVAGTGVTSFLIAVVGTPNALPEEQLRTAVKAIESGKTGTEAVGIFMEGPYINVKRRGAHPPSWLRMPDEGETQQILELSQGHLKLITLAPELPGATAMIRRLIEAGVTVAMGHSDVNYEQAREAIGLGVTHLTHCFNAMRPFLHREPGPIAAVVEAPQVQAELIGDGVHVHRAVMHGLINMIGAERTVVITDAQAGAGVPDGEFEFGGQKAKVLCGAARLSDGSLAGSILTLDQGLRNLLEWTGVSLAEAVGMLSYNPAKAARVADRKGLLKCGYDADLLLFDQDLQLQATICRGKVAHASEAWSERLQDL